MVRRICEIAVTLDFIFRLVHCSSEDVSFNSTCLSVLEGINKFYLLTWMKKKRIETPFKGDNVKASINTLICENTVLYFSEKIQKIAAFPVFFRFSVTKQSLENVLAAPNDQKYPRYSLVLKFNVTLARPLRLIILYVFKWKFLSDDWRLYLHDSKWNSKSDVHGLTHTKQLLNLFCIVYV